MFIVVTIIRIHSGRTGPQTIDRNMHRAMGSSGGIKTVIRTRKRDVKYQNSEELATYLNMTIEHYSNLFYNTDILSEVNLATEGVG